MSPRKPAGLRRARGRPPRAPELVRLAIMVPRDWKLWLKGRAVMVEGRDMGQIVAVALALYRTAKEHRRA